MESLAKHNNSELILSKAQIEEINEFENLNKISFPKELKEWLTVCNGISIDNTYFRLFGINKEQSHLDILSTYEYCEEWKDLGWIPFSTDACGDFYVIDTKNTINNMHPIYFCDQCDYSKPDYIVSSNLWRFIKFMLENEIKSDMDENDKWPFNEQQVVKEDPEIILSKIAPLPWKTDE